MSHAATLPQKTMTVTSWKVACDGSGPADGHPRVWIALSPETGEAECGYCGTRYVIDRDHAHDDH